MTRRRRRRRRYLLKGVLVCDVIHQHSAVGIPVVDGAQGMEPFLTSGVLHTKTEFTQLPPAVCKVQLVSGVRFSYPDGQVDSLPCDVQLLGEKRRLPMTNILFHVVISAWAKVTSFLLLLFFLSHTPGMRA